MHVERVEGGRRPPTPGELWAGVVAEIATMPDVVANLLREHQPDAQGYCTGNGCGSAGRGVPTRRWPCALHALATEAQEAGGASAIEGSTAPGGRPSTPDGPPRTVP
jgi:hypothetical protein